MSYTITKSNGNIIAIPDGTISNVYSTSLVGRITPAYGQSLAQSTIRTLENFANNTSPRGAIKGQLWFDTRTNVMKVWIGNDPVNSTDNTSANPNHASWKSLISTVDSTIIPATNTVDLGAAANRFRVGYFSTVNTTNLVAGTTQLGATTIGGNVLPSTTSQYSIGSASLTFADIYARRFLATQEIVFSRSNGNITLGFIPLSDTAVGMKNTTDTLGSASSRIAGIYASGMYANSLSVGSGQPGYGVITNLIPSTTNAFTLGSDTNRYSKIYGMELYARDKIIPGVPDTTTMGDVNNAFGLSYINEITTSKINARTTTSSIGSQTSPFQNIYGTNLIGTSTSSKYADLAERYEADGELDTGTVVKLGGSKEITMTTLDADTEVFGVISTSAGIMMNADAGADDTHPFVALAGRVPVKVIGPISKGDRLVASDVPGVARRITMSELQQLGPMGVYSIIGRAISSKSTSDVELVLCAIGSK